MIARNGSGETVIAPAIMKCIAPGIYDGGSVLPRARRALRSSCELAPATIPAVPPTSPRYVRVNWLSAIHTPCKRSVSTGSCCCQTRN